VVSCLAGGDGLDDDCTDVLPPLWDLLDDLVGGGGGSPLSPRPLFRLKPLRLLGNGGSPCKEDIAILSCMLQNVSQIKNAAFRLFLRCLPIIQQISINQLAGYGIN
jgi:hypothetical protein